MSNNFENNLSKEVNQDLLKQKLSTAKSIINDVFYVFSMFAGILFINKKSINGIGELLFLLSAINLFSSNISAIFGFLYKIKVYKSMFDIYQTYCLVANIKWTQSKNIGEIKKIKVIFNNQEKYLKIKEYILLIIVC